MGGPERIERQRALGKRPVRERIDDLLDPGTFVEYGLLADSMDPGLQADKGYLAADGMVAGIGEIDGRRVAVCAYDFTVMAGSMGAVGEHKTARMRELALRQRIPIVWLLDSAGARIQATSGSTFAAAGALFREQVTLSGVVPQVAAMLGHCAAGTAYIPGPRRLHPHGEGHLVDGARRPPPGEGGHRRGRHRGGDGRVGRAHQGERRGRPRGRRRRGVPAPSCALPVVLPVEQHRAAAGAGDERSRRPPGRGALRHRADRAAARLRHVPGHRSRSSTTASTSR